MTGFALGLVLIAALTHATWNLLAKRSQGGIAFIFLINAFAVLLYTPLMVAVFLVQRPLINMTAIVFIVGSALIHIVYFLVLQRGYQVGDLSLVYSLARGTGPLLSTIAAMVVLGERPTIVAIMGIVLILGGVFLLTGNPYRIWNSGSQLAVGYGLLTGMFIATYTIWDKYAVSQYHVSPVLLNYGCNVLEFVLLIPFALRYWLQVKQEWHYHQWDVLGVAFLSPLAYILVLIAMVSTPVAYVAPMRELSILVGVVMGNQLLAEAEAPRRLLAAGIIVVGIVTLATN